MPGRRPVVSLSNVSLVLGKKKVLSNVDWKVMPGENWAILGPNGAGKTSLLSIVNGYRWHSNGEVSVLGRKFGETDLRELRKETGLVSAFLDSMTKRDQKVVELVISGKFGSTRTWTKVEAADVTRAKALLKSLGCAEQTGKTLSELSQGERQKVAIARALMAKPKLLILDEPCEGLDIASRENFLVSLERLLTKKDKTSYIEVTHRTEDIPAGFDHALLLREGRVVASGEISKTLTSKNLSKCLGAKVELKRWRGRFYMTARSS